MIKLHFVHAGCGMKRPKEILYGKRILLAGALMPCGDRVQPPWQVWRTRNSEPLAFLLDGARSLECIIVLGTSRNGPPESSNAPRCSFAARDDTKADGPRLPVFARNTNNSRTEGVAYSRWLRACAVQARDDSSRARVMREILRFLSAKWVPDGPVSRNLA